MTSVLRFGFLASAFTFVLMACPPTPDKPDGGRDGGPDDMCFEDTDCPDPHLFFCNTTTSQCEPACHTKNDCTAEVRGMYKLDECDNNALGCQCDNATCVAALCSADVDCGSTKVCRSGKCVDAPAASTAASCIILPDYAVLKTGQTHKFHMEAFDAAGKPVVLNAGVTWSAAGSGTIAAMDSVSADFTAGSTAATEADGPKVTIGSTTCAAKVVVVDGSPATTEIAAIVTDELSARPIAGASVVVTDNAGATLGTPGTTDDRGYAKVTGLAGTETDVNVSVFTASYNYLTIANYNPSATGASRVMSMVLRRNQTDNYGGVKGKFVPTPMTSNVHVGLSGMSIAGAVTDLSLEQLLGTSVPTHVKIGSAVDQEDVPLPAGVFLGFSDQPIKTDVSGQGLAGVCTKLMDSTTKTNTGTCGTRANWGLSGDIPLGDLPIDAFAGGTKNLDFGTILARIIPIFKKFNSSITRDIEFTLKATPKDTDGSPNFDDAGTENFTPSDLPFAQPGAVPLAFDFVTQVPSLPKFRNSFVDGVLMLGGTNVPGRGMVPMGLGIGVNNMPADDKIDKEATLSQQGLMTLRMAPTHDGIEGDQYGILALALSLKSIGASAGLSISGTFTHPPGNKLAFDPTGTTPLPLAAAFPSFPEGAKYNFSDTDAPGLTKRTFKIPTATGSDLDKDLKMNTTLVRVTFSDVQQHRWVVYADPTRVSSDGFHLPKPPMSAVDRTFSNDMSTGDRGNLVVQTIRLADGATQVTYKNLVEASSTNFDRMTDFVQAFSLIDYGSPSITWKSPAGGTTVAHGSTATVTVKGFAVGMPSDATADGYVKVTFAGGTGCDTPALGQTPATDGKGDVNVTIPTTCMGMVTATATLVDPTGTELNPPVKVEGIALTVN